MSAHRLFAAAAACLFTAMLPLQPAGAADLNKRREFDISAQTLSSALVEFGRQTSIQVMTASKDLEGIQVEAIRGTMSIAEALTRLLRGTDLRFQDAGRNSVAIARARAGASRAVPPGAVARLARSSADAMQPARPETKRPDADGTNGELEVTGSRIRREQAEEGFSPVQTYTREDIERSGVVSIGDFMRYIPQNSQDLTGLNTGGGPMGARTLVNLRNLGQGTTLVLLNGKRMVRSGQAFSGSVADYDLSGIPLASIERIEVLTDGASALYGADAIGGVINIITRTDYSGMEASLQYANATVADAAERSGSLSYGFSRARVAGSMAGSYATRNGFGADVRPYTASSDYSASGGRDARLPGGGAGFLYEFDGVLSSGFAGLPEGQDGTALTADDILARDGDAELFDPAPYANVIDETRDRALSADFRYDFTRALTAYVQGRHSERDTHSIGAPPSGMDFGVPAYNPFNPLGVDLGMSKVFYGLGASRFDYGSRSIGYGAGLRGELGATWRYDLELSRGQMRNRADAPVPDTLNADLLTALADSDDPQVAFNFFGDERLPQSAAHLQALRDILGIYRYRTDAVNDVAEIRTDGVVWQAPTGSVRLAAGSEVREEGVEHYSLNTTERRFAEISRAVSRGARAAYAELQIPLVLRDPDRAGLHALELQAAARYDDVDGFDAEFSPKLAMIWQPLKSVRVRASMGEGFRVPNLYFLVQPTTTRNVRYTAVTNVLDRARNELVTGTLSVTTGGNADLRPEQSESRNVGLIVQPAALPGLSFTADYFTIEHTDRVTGSLREQDIIDFHPDRLTRAPAVNGVPGRILSFDRRAANLQGARTSGLDLQVRYRRGTPAGDFDAAVTASRMYEWELQSSASPDSVTDRLDTIGYPKWRMNSTASWQKGPLGAGVNWRYVASVSNTISPRPRRVDSASEFDLRWSYDFGHGPQVRWLQGTRLNLAVLNVLDTTPPSYNGDGGNLYLDPRQRRYSLSLVTQF